MASALSVECRWPGSSACCCGRVLSGTLALWCFCGQEILHKVHTGLFYLTGEFGSVMEGSLGQQDGTSEKVAVKTMKRELPVTTNPVLGVDSCFGIWCSMRLGWSSDVRRPSRALPGHRGTVPIMSSSHLPHRDLTLKAVTCHPLSLPPLSLSLTNNSM